MDNFHDDMNVNDSYQFMDENPVTQNHQGIALNLPNIAMQTIDLYSAKRGDATYPRGISILYQVDGQKSYQLNYVDQDAGNGERGMYYEEEKDTSNNKPNIKLQEELEDDGELEKTTIVLDYNEYVTQIDMYKTDNNIL